MHYKSIEIKSITIPTLLITYSREIKSNCKVSSQNCPTVSYSRIFTKCLIKIHNQDLRARIANYLIVKNIPKNIAHSVNRWKRNLLLLAWDITQTQSSQPIVGFIRLSSQANTQLGLSGCRQTSRYTAGFIRLLSQAN